MIRNFLDNKSDAVRGHRPTALTRAEVSNPNLTVAVPVHTTWNDLKINEDSDTMVVAFLDETFQDIPAINVHLRCGAFEICPRTEDWPKGKKAYRDSY